MTRRSGLVIAAMLAVSAGQAARAAQENAAPPAGERVAPRADPWQPLNRRVFAFNEALDKAIIKPVAGAYRKAVPEFVRQGVENVFGNVTDAWSVVNHLLQGKPQPAAEMTVRVLINTGFGFAGLLDIASEAGLHRQPEDFGQTLGRWGMGPGPYVVLPFFGPRTLRDAAALPLDWQASLQSLPHEPKVRWSLSGLDTIQSRAGLLDATQLVDQVALDKYSFVRDSHLSRRRSLVYDGDPPADDTDDAPR
jgi:phospholipid-binding lipoprotein MlaA